MGHLGNLNSYISMLLVIQGNIFIHSLPPLINSPRCFTFNYLRIEKLQSACWNLANMDIIFVLLAYESEIEINETQHHRVSENLTSRQVNCKDHILYVLKGNIIQIRLATRHITYYKTQSTLLHKICHLHCCPLHSFRKQTFTQPATLKLS